MRILQSFVVFSLVAIVFATGFASSRLLGSWIEELVKLPLHEQFYSVFKVTFGILTAMVAVGLNIVIFCFVIFFVVAFVQEFHYQFFRRKIFNILLNRLRSDAQESVREKSPREEVEALEKARKEMELHQAQLLLSRRKARARSKINESYKGRVEEVGRGEGKEAESGEEKDRTEQINS